MELNARCLVCQCNQTFAFYCSMSSSGGLGELEAVCYVTIMKFPFVFYSVCMMTYGY